MSEGALRQRNSTQETVAGRTISDIKHERRQSVVEMSVKSSEDWGWTSPYKQF